MKKHRPRQRKPRPRTKAAPAEPRSDGTLKFYHGGVGGLAVAAHTDGTSSERSLPKYLSHGTCPRDSSRQCHCRYNGHATLPLVTAL